MKVATLALLAMMTLGLSSCAPSAGSGQTSPPFCLFPPPARILPATTLQQTGRVFDLAIKGNGYFTVRDPIAGKNRYTRFGQFRLTSEGALVTTDGRHVIEPQLTIPTDAVEVQITSDGFLKLRMPDSPNNPDAPKGLQRVGQVQLTHFSRPEFLQTVQPTILEETCASGQLIMGPPGQQGLGTLLVGTLEVENPANASDSGAKPR
jgi:flagellar basal-body rod protein FlgG